MARTWIESRSAHLKNDELMIFGTLFCVSENVRLDGL
jgi:hypothetical protein